jgi:DNA-binding MurR/RpiR family transcriptional regulator
MDKAAAAMSYDELRGAIAQRHRALSGRLQQIAEFVLDHPTEVALGTVAEVAERSGVPPSAIVRSHTRWALAALPRCSRSSVRA